MTNQERFNQKLEKISDTRDIKISDTANISAEMWEKSRSGAWAVRGFDYQHMVSALILVRQWAGLTPSGYLVPEGFEDCVIESSDRNTWIQIKSRKEDTFSNSEIDSLLNAIEAKAASIKSGEEFRAALILEKPCLTISEIGIDQLLKDDSQTVFVCSDPYPEIIRLISKQLGVAEMIAEGLANNLYRLVADTSAGNASVAFDTRMRISTTEVERQISEYLECSDSSAINEAFYNGALQPIDFVTPIDEPNFYQGVKVKPGHVAASLVVDRPDDVNRVTDMLKRKKNVLVSGPSGAGKSALLWLSANGLAGESKLFQVTGLAAVADTENIIRFVRARRPISTSPISLIFDEVGSTNSDLWNVLAHNLSGLGEVYLLGSIRQEDTNLIVNQADTEFIPVRLDENLAQRVWQELSARNQTNWTHWREPFEQSDGLMLEYVHILTRGKRLDDVISDQVRQRETEGRNNELAIIRSTAVLCAHGGEVRADRLFELLELEPGDGRRSLRRLIDEHLVRESRSGVLGGLHMLRSKALCKASHDEIAFITEDTLWHSLPATTKETLPRLVQSLLADIRDEEEDHVLLKLAQMLGKNRETDLWIAVLTGLGLATLERSAVSFISILEQHGLHRYLWHIAAVAAVIPDFDITGLSEHSQSQNLQDAISAFQKSPIDDLRSACLKKLSTESRVPTSFSIEQTNKLFSCLVPIFGSEPVKIPFEPDFANNSEPDIYQVATFLSTAYLIGPDLAENFVKIFGGEQFLFNLFHSQTPWVTAPVIDSNGTHGRTVRSDWFYVDEEYQPDPHSTIVNICETLLALSPRSNAVACDAINPFGEIIAVDEFSLWSKNIPRKNLPPDTRIAWNVAFAQIMAARTSTTDRLTDYAKQMDSLVRRTEKVFHSYTEKWIKGKSISKATVDSLITEIKGIVDGVSEFIFTDPITLPHLMTKPVKASDTDNLGNLLISVLTNLLPRLNEIEGIKATATFAGDLATRAEEHSSSDIWRIMSSPHPKLATLSSRLDDVMCVMHEMDQCKGGPTKIPGIMKPIRKAPLGKAVASAARHCRSIADQRFRKKLSTVEKAFKERGWTVRCIDRTLDENDSPYWPPRDVAILVILSDFETEEAMRYYMECPIIGEQSLGSDWQFRTVPVVNNLLLPHLALHLTSIGPIPDLDFSRDWSDHIDYTFLKSEVLEKFDEAAAACISMSAIIACCGHKNDLHTNEVEAISQAKETFNRNYHFLAKVVECTDSEDLELALEYLYQSYNRVVKEVEDTDANNVIDNPLYKIVYTSLDGEENEDVLNLACIRLMIMQDELS
ncbi:MAG: hypothetical protein OXG75_08255, partial [Candidatus Dadabacteria bacterium]|nr:hypothetical protein [Candidatus Dadabacteria bacterium]